MKHNITINVHADDNIKILGDGDQMVQLIMILCDNALKYSPENGTVSIGANKLDDGGVLVTVSDQGKGIPEEDIPFIWERFYKVENRIAAVFLEPVWGLLLPKKLFVSTAPVPR